MSEYHFLRPLDILYLRGNRLFGDSSATGEAIMPPWPSMAAGAIRSQILSSQGIDSSQFALGQAPLSGALSQSLGNPDQPGSFRVSHFLLAKLDGNYSLTDVYMPLPADVVVIGDRDNRQCHYLKPQPMPDTILSSAPCGQIPVLRIEKQLKPISGLWLNLAGIQAWLNGQALQAEHLVNGNCLWQLDSRLGIALDAEGRTTSDGQLYTVEAVAMLDGMGFLIGMSGADGLLPVNGLLRFGGDGRGAQHSRLDWESPQPDWNMTRENKRFRLLLTSPGLFEQGWLLPGMSAQGEYQWKTEAFSARLVTASIARAETISGWDIAKNHPKPALKAVGVGSVYWFDCFEGDVGGLEKLVKQGLIELDMYPDCKRRAEGFNNIAIASWPL